MERYMHSWMKIEQRFQCMLPGNYQNVRRLCPKNNEGCISFSASAWWWNRSRHAVIIFSGDNLIIYSHFSFRGLASLLGDSNLHFRLISFSINHTLISRNYGLISPIPICGIRSYSCAVTGYTTPSTLPTITVNNAISFSQQIAYFLKSPFSLCITTYCTAICNSYIQKMLFSVILIYSDSYSQQFLFWGNPHDQDILHLSNSSAQNSSFSVILINSDSHLQ